jgi:indolepyruvate decarboxylase
LARGKLADDAPIKPSDIACAVNDLFDRHGPMPMTSHIGDCLFTAMEIENTALAAPAVTREWASGCPLALASLRRPNGARSSWSATERSR